MHYQNHLQLAAIMKKLLPYLFLLTASLSTTAFAQEKKPSPPTPIIIQAVEQKTFADTVEALGTLRANESVALTASVTELVTAINFDDGQRVKKGAVLIEMDAAEEEAQLAEEQSTLIEAKRQLDRVETLAAKGVSSESSFDERQLNVKTATARLKAIQSRINQRIIKAPFDGVIGLRNISVGALIQPGSLIANIDDDSIMKLDFSIPAIYISTLTPNMTIAATTKAYPKTIFEGKVHSIDNRIDPVTRSIIVRALIPNEQHQLKPGLLMRVTLSKNIRHSLVTPEETLTTTGTEQSVLVVKDTDEALTVEKRIITIGARHDGEIEVLSGLQVGERVVTHGIIRAQPGKPVKIIATQQGGESLQELLKQSDNS